MKITKKIEKPKEPINHKYCLNKRPCHSNLNKVCNFYCEYFFKEKL